MRESGKDEVSLEDSRQACDFLSHLSHNNVAFMSFFSGGALLSTSVVTKSIRKILKTIT